MSAATALATAPIGSTDVRVTKLGFGTSGLGDMPDTYGYRVNLLRLQRCAVGMVRKLFTTPAGASASPKP